MDVDVRRPMTVDAERETVPMLLRVTVAVGALVALALVGVRTAQLQLRAEPLAVERTAFTTGTVEVHLRNRTRAPQTVAQVLVNDAFWQFTSTRSTVGARELSVVTLRYPWTAGEPLTVEILMRNGHRLPIPLIAIGGTGEGGRSPSMLYAVIALTALAGAALSAVVVALGVRRGALWRSLAAGGALGVVTGELVQAAFGAVKLASDITPRGGHALQLFVVLALTTGACAWLSVAVAASRFGARVAHLGLLSVALGLGGFAIAAQAGVNLLTGLTAGALVEVGVVTTALRAGTAGGAWAMAEEGRQVGGPLAAAGALVAALPAVAGFAVAGIVGSSGLSLLAFGLASGTLAVAAAGLLSGSRRHPPTLVTPAFAMAIVVLWATRIPVP